MRILFYVVFKVTASQLSPSSNKCSILLLADSESDKSKWVGVLNELHRILRKNKLKDRSVYIPKEAYDSTLPLIKNTQSAAILGELLWKKSCFFFCFQSWISFIQCIHFVTGDILLFPYNT